MHERNDRTLLGIDAQRFSSGRTSSKTAAHQVKGIQGTLWTVPCFGDRQMTYRVRTRRKPLWLHK